jgi:hypothetical protein
MKSMQFIVVIVLVTSMGVTVAQDRGPQPPCGTASSPPFPSPEAPPVVEVWHATDLTRIGWTPAACTGWSAASRAKLIVVVAGSFRFQGTTEDLLARLGSVSSHRNIRYWSTTDKAWRPTALDAVALLRPDRKSERSDFSPSEMSEGSELYYWWNDSRSGSIIHRMNVRERRPGRIVIAIENVSPVRALVFTLFGPGMLQTVEFLEQRGPNLWGLYLITRVSANASALAFEHDASYVNRAVALYRYIAGMQTDQEPPAAP